MAEVVQIPRTIGSAKKALATIEGLLTAREWERSAIVAAFTHDHVRGQKTCPSCTDLNMTEAQFADLQIPGLARQAVRHYRSVWQEAIRKGEAVEVRPGKKVTLPTSKFPAISPNVPDPVRRKALTEQAEIDEVGVSKVLNVAGNPRAVATALKADPEFAQRVMKDPAVSDAVLQAMTQNTTDEADLKNPDRAHASSGRPANRSEPVAATAIRELGAAKKAHEAHELVRQVLEVWHLLSEDGKDAVMEEWEPMISEIEATRSGSFSDEELATLLKEG